MRNPAIEWSKEVNFQSISFNDFPRQKERKYYFIQKIDGEHNTVVYDRKAGDCYMITRDGKIKRNLLVLANYREIFEAKKEIKRIEIPGELIGFKRGILPFNQTMHAIRNAERDINSNRLLIHYPVDIFRLNGKSLDIAASIRYLAALFYNTKRIRVPMFYKGDLDTAWSHFLKIPGIDGIVARNSINYKIKMNYTVDLALLAVGSKKINLWNSNRISYLVGAFMNERGQFITTSNIGTGFNDKMRQQIFDWAMSNKVSEDDNNVWVKPSQVFEMRFKNVFRAPKPLIEYKNGYRTIGDFDSFNFVDASFVRFRPDKSVIYNNLRLSQIPPVIKGKKV